MKKTIKAVLMTGAVALATTVAQANTYTLIGADNITDTLTGGIGATPKSFTVLSQVASDGVAGPTEYQYTYTVSATAPLVDQFNVDDLYAGSSFSIGANPAGFTGVYDAPADNVQWNTANSLTLVSLDNLVFTLYSAAGPTLGGSGAIDSSTWSDNTSLGVNVPFTVKSVPDGGMTVSFMGAALLGLAAVRRKLGC